MENKVNTLYATVYRYPHGDCSNHGISSKENILLCLDGDIEDFKQYIEEYGLNPDECLYVVRRVLWGKADPYLTPLRWAINKPDGNVSFGGNYAIGDSRWNNWFGHNLPLPIHDRLETWDEYVGLSR